MVGLAGLLVVVVGCLAAGLFVGGLHTALTGNWRGGVVVATAVAGFWLLLALLLLA